MLKVLVVDDNDLIRKSLVKRIDWEGMDLVCVGEAADGQEALEKIRELSPSIVITDVRMPIADGFYTIERCRANAPEVQFIIISGYDDFPYVKKAVQRDVVDYILKPIDTDELCSTLEKARERVYQYRSRQQQTLQTQEYRRHYQEQRVANLFLLFLTHKIDWIDFREQIEQADYPLNQEFCACIGVNICALHGDNFRQLTPAQTADLEYQMEALYLNSTCKLLYVYRNIYVIACTYQNETRFSTAIQEQMYQIIQQGLHVSGEERLFVCFSAVQGCDKLRDAYQQCLQQLLWRFIEPERLIFNPQPSSGKNRNAKWHTQMERLEIALDLQLKEDSKMILHKLLEYARKQPELLWECLPQVLLLIDQKLENQLSIREFDTSLRQFYMLRFYDFEQMEQTLYRLVDNISPSLSDIDIGEKVVTYVNEHFSQQLTLRSLGDLFHVNHIYLGQLMKKKTGVLFHTYLNQLRIEKAKKLIRTNSEIVIRDLSYSLGFTDSHYFTKVFKQNVGLTPTEYKEKFSCSRTETK